MMKNVTSSNELVKSKPILVIIVMFRQFIIGLIDTVTGDRPHKVVVEN